MIGVQMPSVRDVGPSSTWFPAINCWIAIGFSKWPVGEREGCAISLIQVAGRANDYGGRQSAVCLTPQLLRRSRLRGCDRRAKTLAIA
jgi:hypothetical protein